jgi:hypothetical protein
MVLRWLETKAERAVSSAPPFNKLDLAPGLQDLEDSVVVLAVLEMGRAVYDGACLHPSGFGVCGESSRAASSSSQKQALGGQRAATSPSSAGAGWPA